jgi:hypothetical protein
MTKLWTVPEEAERLARRLAAVPNKAAFARENRVPGGASMLSQHIHGHRPLSMEAAMAYSRGFNVPLEEISPRLAELALAAAQLTRNSALSVQEPSPRFDSTDSASVLEHMGMLLAALPLASRGPVGTLMEAWAREGGNDQFRSAISAVMVTNPPRKQSRRRA